MVTGGWKGRSESSLVWMAGMSRQWKNTREHTEAGFELDGQSHKVVMSRGSGWKGKWALGGKSWSWLAKWFSILLCSSHVGICQTHRHLGSTLSTNLPKIRDETHLGLGSVQNWERQVEVRQKRLTKPLKRPVRLCTLTYKPRKKSQWFWDSRARW